MSEREELLAQIAERRNDTEFMARLRERMTEDAPILARLSDSEEFIAGLRAIASHAVARADAAEAESAALRADRGEQITKWVPEARPEWSEAFRLGYSKARRDCIAAVAAPALLSPVDTTEAQR